MVRENVLLAVKRTAVRHHCKRHGTPAGRRHVRACGMSSKAVVERNAALTHRDRNGGHPSQVWDRIEYVLHVRPDCNFLERVLLGGHDLVRSRDEVQAAVLHGGVVKGDWHET